MENLNLKIDNKFANIEAKLKNSFQAIKSDFEGIKRQINEASKQKPVVQANTGNKELAELTKQIVSLKKDIVTKNDLAILEAEFENKFNVLKKQTSRAEAERLATVLVKEFDAIVYDPSVPKGHGFFESANLKETSVTRGFD